MCATSKAHVSFLNPPCDLSEVQGAAPRSLAPFSHPFTQTSCRYRIPLFLWHHNLLFFCSLVFLLKAEGPAAKDESKNPNTVTEIKTVLGDAVAARAKRPTDALRIFKSSQFFPRCESFSLTARQEHRLRTLKRISGAKKQGVEESGKECIMKRFIICVLSPNIIASSQMKGGWEREWNNSENKTRL